MFDIDKYAYASELKSIDPMEKLMAAGVSLSVCLWADSILVSVVLLLVMGWLTVRFGRTPLSAFLKLLTLPASFLILGVVTIALGVSDHSADMVWSFPFMGHLVGILQGGVGQAVHLFFRALGATGCLYFLSLSTPIVDLLSAFRRLHCPKLLLELMSLIYRFIFVLIETADTMYVAQNARLGYARLDTSFRSMGALASTLFIRAYKRSDDLYTALESRGYDGELNVLEEPFRINKRNYWLAIAVNGGLVLAVLLARRYTGGIF